VGDHIKVSVGDRDAQISFDTVEVLFQLGVIFVVDYAGLPFGHDRAFVEATAALFGDRRLELVGDEGFEHAVFHFDVESDVLFFLDPVVVVELHLRRPCSERQAALVFIPLVRVSLHKRVNDLLREHLNLDACGSIPVFDFSNFAFLMLILLCLSLGLDFIFVFFLSLFFCFWIFPSVSRVEFFFFKVFVVLPFIYFLVGQLEPLFPLAVVKRADVN